MAKAAMRDEMTGLLGGEDGLADWLGSILNGIYVETQKYVEQAAVDIEDSQSNDDQKPTI
jgi:hypothetical protein